MSRKETIEDYVLGDHLGHGQFATVRLARNKHTGDVFAIKIIDLSKMTDKLVNEPMVRQRVLNEVNIHRDKGLRHPSIVKCFSAFADGRNVYLVLEWCNMGTLKSYVENKKRLSEKEARCILGQIVEGLLVLHKNSIMHRDISMGNVLLSRDRQNNLQAKIADFGLAERLENPDMKHFTMCGTPNYMSPEVASGSGHGLATDIFSLGSVLYTMLVGGPPFESSDLLETINRIKAVLYKMPNLLSAKAQHLIMSVMRLSPDDRLKLNEILDHPFLKGTSLDEFRNKYPGKNPCAEWSMDSGCGTCTTELTSVMSSVVSRTLTSQPMSKSHVQQLSGNGSYQQAGLSVSQSDKRPLAPPNAMPATCPAKPQPQQPAISRNHLNLANTASDCYFKADAESVTSSHYHGHVVQSNPAMISSSTSGVESVRESVMAPETGRSCKVGHRQTPVMPHRSTRNHQLVEFNSHDGGSVSSSPSTSSCVQTPVISDASKDSNLSDEISELLPGGQILADNGLDFVLENDASSLNSVQLGGHLAHCSSETNLVTASGSMPHANRSRHTHGTAVSGRQVIGTMQSLVSAEYAQQLRRRSRSVDNLSRRHKEKADSAAWSAVDIDIRSESTVTDRMQQLDVQQQQQMKQSSTREKPIDSLPPPFTTARLRPFRQQMNSVVYTILDDGCVCMEFFRVVGGTATVLEVMRISASGLQIQIYKPNNGKGCSLSSQPPPPPALGSVHLKHFTLEALPRKHWRKYSYAALFVTNIRAKTPKVTLYTQRAKFQVMENSDVEVTFYDGAKYHKANDAVRVILHDGSLRTLSTPSSVTELSEEGQEMCQYVSEILQICTDMTNVLTSLQAHCGRGPDVSLFPIVVGRRPMTSASSPCNSASISTDQLPVNQPSIAPASHDSSLKSQPSYKTQSVGQQEDVVSSREHRHSSRSQLSAEVPSSAVVRRNTPASTSISQHRPASSQSVTATQQIMSDALIDQRLVSQALPPSGKQRLICSVEVPGIGRAAKYTHGIVWLYYNDGSQLGVKVNSPSFIVDVSPEGRRVTYQANDEIPESVRWRVANDLQTSMAHLNMLREV